MHTSLRIDGANCPTCFNETLDDLANLDGVRSVHGSSAGPCIEVDHDVALETITGTIGNRLHGIARSKPSGTNPRARGPRHP